MSDTFGLKIGIEGEKAFKQSLREINNDFKVLGSEMKLATSSFEKNEKSIESLTTTNKVLEDQITTQKNKIGMLKSALDNASTSFGENDRRTKQWKIQLNNATAELNNMERELSSNVQEVKHLSEVMGDGANNAKDLANQLEHSGDIAAHSKDKFDGITGSIKKVSVALGAAVIAIGAVAVKVGAELVGLGDDYNQMVNQIGASTGATGDELAGLGEVARKVYTNNFGDSLEDVAQGLSLVKQITGLMDEELQQATQSGFALRDTFGYDLQESARTANALMQNFGLSAQDAYNIITVGAQNGADQNGDLLDTLNEYSSQYSALGLSAQQFVSGLVEGSKQGVFSIDKVGDAVKEFNIRAKDGSKSTIGAFSRLGMNAGEMMSSFAKGGDEANESFFKVVNALEAINDPMVKNAIAVDLFGTQYEDLESTVLPVLASMEDSSIATKDALSELTEIKYDNLDSALEGTKRSIQGVFLPAVSQMSAGITDAFSVLGNSINEADGDMGKISVSIGHAMQEIASTITQQLPMFLDVGMEIIMAIGQAIVSNLSLLVDTANSMIMTLLTGLVEALPQITTAVVQLVLSLVQGILDNAPLFVEAAVGIVASLVTGLGEALPELIPAIFKAIVLMRTTLLENMDQIITAGFTLIQGLMEGLLAALPELISSLPKIMNAMVTFFVENLPLILELGTRLIGQLAVGLIEAIPQLIMAMPLIVGAIVGGIGKTVGAVFNIGKNIVQGLWEGIKSLGSWIGEKVGGFFTGIVDGAKSLLGIHSPSRVFAGIGENMGLGIGVGFTDAMQGVEQDIQGAIPTDFDIATNANVATTLFDKATTAAKSVIQHTGVIKIEGVNDEGQMISVVDVIIDRLRQEVRV